MNKGPTSALETFSSPSTPGASYAALLKFGAEGTPFPPHPPLGLLMQPLNLHAEWDTFSSPSTPMAAYVATILMCVRGQIFLPIHPWGYLYSP